jgi:hypothetical protein
MELLSSRAGLPNERAEAGAAPSEKAEAGPAVEGLEKSNEGCEWANAPPFDAPLDAPKDNVDDAEGIVTACDAPVEVPNDGRLFAATLPLGANENPVDVI